MGRGKKYQPEQVVNLLRQIEVSELSDACATLTHPPAQKIGQSRTSTGKHGASQFNRYIVSNIPAADPRFAPRRYALVALSH
jgi:hypothetical protein